jgi:hypothetical protein
VHIVVMLAVVLQITPLVASLMRQATTYQVFVQWADAQELVVL